MGSRNLYLSNTPVEEALDKYRQALALARPESETLAVSACAGRVTAKAVFALYNSPLYDSAAMDGIAVISSATVGARETAPLTLIPGRDFLVIDTGDPIRPPYDAVIMAEDIEPQPDSSAVIRAAASPWQHIRPVGEDIVKGEMLIPGLHRIRPIDVGVLLSGGITELEVLKKPRVSVIPTGSELIEPGTVLGDGDIIESNSRMFEALISEEGGTPLRHGIVKDSYEEIRQAVKQAVGESDIVLLLAGSSAGTEDYSVHVLRELGEVVIHGVAMKPGKPVILAVIDKTPVIGIPGYPVSAYLAFKSFVSPILAWLAAKRQAAEETAEAVLSRTLVSSLKHREYVRVKLGYVGDRLIAAPLARGAGAAMSLVRSDGFCIIERESEGNKAGERVTVVLTRSLDELKNTLVSIGSHDLIMDILADLMPEIREGFHLSSTHVGSMAGLMALSRGETHIAPIHLLDEGGGGYNLPILRTMFPDGGVALFKGVGRTQGIMVKKGNPLNIKGLRDLLAVRYVNRQRGAGTRVLLDFLLKKEGIDPSEIRGYEREAATHMAVAAAVASDGADAGLGVLSAAKAMGLDFIPVGQEEYDFAVPREFLGLPQVQAFIEALKSEDFDFALERLGGYTRPQAGEVVGRN
jgi:putative molybdopterin biosynthesis protein